jgi:aspartyl-tRNA(Asn)/glutamyl-tRNA(Gln) amidotransferase subunit A
MDLLRSTLTRARAALERGEVSSEELTRALISQARRVQPVLNAFIAIDEDDALAAARRADAERGDARRTGAALAALHGIPLAHKDMFYRAGRASTCGSRILAREIQPATATVLARLDAAGAFEFGRLGMSEFAYGVTGHNVHYGDVANAWDAAHVAGGSSSGSASSVAACANFAALGTDTGASVRVPAACNGVVGIKTTFGAVSRAAAMPLSQSLDTVGLLARSVEDCALVFGVIAGVDPADPPTGQWPFRDGWSWTPRADLRGVRVGVADNFGHGDCSGEVAAAYAQSLDALRARGAEIVAVSVPDPDELQRAAMVVLQAEPAALHRQWMQTRAADYSPQVLTRLQAGLSIPAHEYIDALRLRSPMLERMRREVFAHCDALHAPVLTFAVPTRAETDVGGGPRMREMVSAFGRLTRPINFLGLPALSLPAGLAGGLPVGFQLIGPRFSEAMLFGIGSAYQAERGFVDWHPRIALDAGAA